MDRQSKAYRASKTLQAASKRLLAAAQYDIRVKPLTFHELEIWYDPATNLKCTYCNFGIATYRVVEPVYLN